MQQFKWWDKCIEAGEQPESLLHSQNGSRIMPGHGMSSSSFCADLASNGSRRRTRCGNLSCLLFGSILFIIFLLIWRYLISSLPDSQAEYSEFEQKFLDSVSNDSLSGYLKRLTWEPHVAGTSEDYATADYVYGVFQTAGLATHYADYDVLLSFPVQRNLILSDPDGLFIEFALEEAVVDEDPYTKSSEIIPTFHGYSPSGNVTAEVVYANYGTQEDFDLLVKIGVKISGAIVLARSGKVYRGDIVHLASLHGALAVVTYSDPQDYSSNRTEGFYPQSKWLPPTGVQRGTVFRGIGDPLTPGWASTTSAERLDVKDAELPLIPSLPISAQDAKSILKVMAGPRAPASWQGALDLDTYRVGRGPAKLNLTYVAKQGVSRIRNVIGIIEGFEESDRLVVVGNHRDAWAFGAVDPGSGSAALLELARILGQLTQQGWRPRRTIVFGSWDAEEYGMVGSTEWVEENLGLLGARAVAYLNVDCAVSGSGFNPRSSPQFDALLREITQKVGDPDGIYATVFDSWQAASESGVPKIGRLGTGGSDFESFLHHAGIPAMDLAFGDDYPVYHSEYDNYHWMEKFGDPFFHRHVALTSIWGVITMRLADQAVLPLDYQNYGQELQKYTSVIKDKLEKVKAPESVSLSPLWTAVWNFMKSADYISEESNVFKSVRSSANELFYFHLRRRAINDRLMLTERAFLDADGLVARPWYKHLVFSPSVSNSYDTSVFPGILDSLAVAVASNSSTEAQNWKVVQHEIWRVARAVTKAETLLNGILS